LVAKRVFMTEIEIIHTRRRCCVRCRKPGAACRGRSILQAWRRDDGAGSGACCCCAAFKRDQLLSATTWLTLPAARLPFARAALGRIMTDAVVESVF